MTRVILGDISCDTKGEAAAYFRKLLWGGQLDVRVPEPAATDLHFLFLRHPKVIAKPGVAIDHFVIARQSTAPAGSRLFGKTARGTRLRFTGACVLRAVYSAEYRPLCAWKLKRRFGNARKHILQNMAMVLGAYRVI
jgi:hypothetical protein